MRVLITGGSGFIGGRLCSRLIQSGHEICNIDLQRPSVLCDDRRYSWVEGSVLNAGLMHGAIASFQPSKLVHLAAETNVEVAKSSLEDSFPVNCGAIRVLAGAVSGSLVDTSVIVSTQFVCGPAARLPISDTEFTPHTDYGRSKVVMERECRQLWPSAFTILRPTYVWGPHHTKYFRDVCRTLARGFYRHPSGPPVVRAYATVDTVVDRIVQLMDRPDLSGRVFYATDEPEDSYDFVNRLSIALRGSPVRRIPRPALRLLGLIGDHWKRFPMNSFRYQSMTSAYPVPYLRTFETLGRSRPDLERTAQETAEWYHRQLAA